MQLRVLVVDDSRSYRALLASGIDASGVARCVAHAADGKEAIARLEEFRPDVVTLDVEMPGMSGLATLPELIARKPGLSVIMVSAVTRQGAGETVRALELGAWDFITKPIGNDPAGNREQLHVQLKDVLTGLVAAKESPVPRARSTAPVLAALSSGSAAAELKPKPGVPPAKRPSNPLVPAGPAAVRPSTAGSAAPLRRSPGSAPALVAIGSSTGGPVALAKLIPGLPKSFPVPIVIVQHMPAVFTASLAESLAAKSALRVVEAKHGVMPEAGTVYIAPGGRHLKVIDVGGVRRFELTDDAPENYCRPAVDVLFRSVAASCREQAVGVILTGMGRDGTAGLRAMKQFGVRVIGQSAESCTVYGMPREAKEAGVVDIELPVEKITDELLACVGLQARA